MDDKILIDTDILIDFLRSGSAARELMKKIRARRLATTDINAFELYHGASKSKNKQANIAGAEDLLDTLEVLSTDRESMKKAAEIAVSLDKAGSKIDLADIFIASLAVTKSAAVLTRNKRHFEKTGARTIGPEDIDDRETDEA